MTTSWKRTETASGAGANALSAAFCVHAGPERRLVRVFVPHAASPDSPGASLETGRRVPGNRLGGCRIHADGGGPHGFKLNQNDFFLIPHSNSTNNPKGNPKHNPEKERQTN